MKIKTLFAMIIASLSLTACGEFNSVEKSSDQVFESIDPYLSAEDQQTMDELSKEFEAPITIRDNVLDSNAVEVEILGNTARLEIVNEGNIAFLLNGREVSFDDLDDKKVLEEIILNSLLYVNNSMSASVLHGSAKEAHAFLGGGAILSTVFRLVLTGIFNYAKTELGPAVGQVVDTVGNVITGGSNSQQPNTNNPSNGGSNNGNASNNGGFLGQILSGIVGAITGNTNNNTGSNTGNNGSNTGNQQPPQQQQPQGCNSLFCNLIGLFASAVF